MKYRVRGKQSGDCLVEFDHTEVYNGEDFNIRHIVETAIACHNKLKHPADTEYELKVLFNYAPPDTGHSSHGGVSSHPFCLTIAIKGDSTHA